jgi:tripartite-type tricarboxylate transporter receptor subunit TctC
MTAPTKAERIHSVRHHGLRFALVVLLAAMSVLPPADARAQGSYPNQTIRLIVPFTAGGLPDTIVRIIAPSIQTRLRATVIIENRPGGGGGVAAAALAAAPPDGYQLIITDLSFLSTNPLIYKQLTYDPKDFITVAQVGVAPLYLAVHPSVPAKSLVEFVDYARGNPGKINYGSSGVGSLHHLSMEALKAHYKLEMTHVPFRGTGQSVPALLGGHVQALFSAYPSLGGAAQAKEVTILAGNGAKRSPQLPEAPTVAEFIPGFDFASRIGIFARTGTPSAITKLIAETVIAVTREPETINRFSTAGIDAAGSGPEDFAKALESERARVEAVVKVSGIEPQ